MRLILRITAITYLLFILTIHYTTPNQRIIKQQNQKVSDRVEKKAENQYIAQDTHLTRQIMFQQLVTDLKMQLKTNQNQAIENIQKQYPNVHFLHTYKEQMLSFQSFMDRNLIKVKQSPIYFQNGKPFTNLDIPIRQGARISHYVFKIDEELPSHIHVKQQSRMYTVTHLQNHKWETIPTQYQPRKKLSLDIEQNLPDLKPNAETKGISHYIQNEVLIKFKKIPNQKELQLFLNQYQLQLKKKQDHTMIVYCPTRSTKKLITILEKDSRIEYVEPHFIYLTNELDKKPSQNRQSFIPNDRLYLDYQWNLPNIDTEQGWNFTKGNKDIIVAVVDTGVDLNHPEFQGKLVKGYNVINPNRLPMDDDGHGTHVAGIISANTNNGQGIAGITWYNKIMPIKVLDQSGAGTLFDVAQGIIWATDHGADVINLSLGNYAESKYLHDAIRYAFSKNVVLIAATGNDNTDQLGYPAAYPEVIGVSAVDPNQQRAEFSNYGDDVDVVAPGVNIASTYPNNRYAALSGTSMASPHVAALAALIKSDNPMLTNREIISIITKTATDLGMRGKDPYFGYGEINIGKAVNLSNQLKQKQEKAYDTHRKRTLPKKENFFQRLLHFFRS
ncbi:S8 family peptidase [Tepidibacillus fermentans]|uniref:Type VII secretion-associated serine protease mycosin n=1 Tax=Tepidibacillus fermentans TaxID=1281767 RepID=A0A4R3KJZ0_9BACI|nr:S8 family peptidase [Tepidibacillus fermentans]TCS83685.1 type VII secretion-associated serine protease mycosin [Tepidibacillus fermentans]